MLLKKFILLALCLDLAFIATRYVTRGETPVYFFHSAGQDVRLPLKRGPYTAHVFLPKEKLPRAVIIFGSGDGGWSGWEDRVSEHLRDAGYEVIGMDSADYASTDYDLSTLQDDYRTIAVRFLAPYGAKPPPLVVGGWSMGAAQAIAVAGGPRPPANLKGVLLASALSRGRYGLRFADKLNILPKGPGTFAVDDFTPSIDRLPLVQWHGANDTIDSRAWLAHLRDRHREYDLPDAGHNYNNASDVFLRRFLGSVDWLLQPEPSTGRELDARNG